MARNGLPVPVDLPESRIAPRSCLRAQLFDSRNFLKSN